MIHDEDKDIVSEVAIEAHITTLLETAYIIIEKVKKDHRGLDYIKISYREKESLGSLGCRYYMISAYKDTNELLQNMERWVRSFIKDNSYIDFTNGAFKNFNFSFF